jgi:hypothetical protein
VPTGDFNITYTPVSPPYICGRSLRTALLSGDIKKEPTISVNKPGENCTFDLKTVWAFCTAPTATALASFFLPCGMLFTARDADNKIIGQKLVEYVPEYKSQLFLVQKIPQGPIEVDFAETDNGTFVNATSVTVVVNSKVEKTLVGYGLDRVTVKLNAC